MTNSEKVGHELQWAAQKFKQALRSAGSGRTDSQAAADCFDRLVAAISDIDKRLVAMEKAQERGQLAGTIS